MARKSAAAQVVDFEKGDSDGTIAEARRELGTRIVSSERDVHELMQRSRYLRMNPNDPYGLEDAKVTAKELGIEVTALSTAIRTGSTR